MGLLDELNNAVDKCGDFWDALEVVTKQNDLDNDEIELLKSEYDQQ